MVSHDPKVAEVFPLVHEMRDGRFIGTRTSGAA
jgi:hypothetical protein